MTTDPERLVGNYTRKVLTTLKSYDVPEMEAGLYGLYILSVQQSDPDRWMALRRGEDARTPGTARMLYEAIENPGFPGECVVQRKLPDEAVWKLTPLFDEISLKGEDIQMGVSERLAEAAHGGYSTPPSVADLVVELANPSFGTAVYDPACRTGNLLVRCARHVIRNATEPYIRLYGAARGEKEYCITRLNLKANGLGNDEIWKTQGSVYPDQGLRVASGEESDLVLVLLDMVEVPGEVGSGEYLLDEVRPSLAPWGLLALLIPGKVLAGEDYWSFRDWLIEWDVLEAAIRLPNGLFPKIRTDIDLLLVRPEKPARGRVLFVDASAMPVDRRRALAGGLAGEIVDLYRAFHQEDAVVGPDASGLPYRIVSTPEIEQVESNSFKVGYDLNVSRYAVPELEPVDFEAEFARLADYKHRREELGWEMEERMRWVLERMRRG